ncbi:aa3-type cytochrome oxidase subunit IV [Streptomyces herbicida]|uniref:aa3-type cytochrome oxidase subunit IV n=1 Tax=Streptomyces herbicida TaxID=3065675 RepID=UPI00292E55B6|nr:cytochrome c oxidase subunit 4 [Streptomyces sp. NEAU-HV9]
MKVEALLFGGVALFFVAVAALYGAWSHDPAGTAALIVAGGMAAVIAFFCAVQYVRKGRRPQDRTDAEVADGAGPLEFFPAESVWPLVTAFGFALAATGVVFGLWLFLIGFGVLARGVLGMVFQYVNH